MPDRIREVRLQHGPRSQRQFARDLGVFQQNVNRYESGTTPAVAFLHILALKEKVNLNWVIFGHGKMALPRAHA